MAATSTLCPCSSRFSTRTTAAGDRGSGERFSLNHVATSRLECGPYSSRNKSVKFQGHLRRKECKFFSGGYQVSAFYFNSADLHQHGMSSSARNYYISSKSSQWEPPFFSRENPRCIGFRRSAAKVEEGLTTASTVDDGESTALPEGATREDAEYIRMAVELARKAVGHTSPNPMVGCVIVKDGQIVGRGFHPKAGEPHAEVFALREAGKNAQGATAYVSLEPCNHTGRTPPCSQALVRARVSRVVVGTVDPNPLVGGKGVQTLRNAGIKVIVGVEEALCQATAETFFHRIVTKKPFVTLRYAMSLDGAVLDSQEKTAEAGSHYSRLLQEHDAVIVTDKCILNNPTLLSSEAGAKQPLRVVLAKSLDLPLDSHVFDTSVSPTLVITDGDAIARDMQNSSKQSAQSMESTLRSRGVDVVAMNEMNLDAVLDLLYQKGFNSVLLDSRVCTIENYLGPLSLSEQGPQKVVVVISPVIVGNKVDGPGFQVEDDVLKLERVTTKSCGGDVIVEGYVSKRSSENL